MKKLTEKELRQVIKQAHKDIKYVRELNGGAEISTPADNTLTGIEIRLSCALRGIK